MSAPTRIYAISGYGKTSLVKASTKAQAISHVCRAAFTTEVASQDDLVALLGQGIAVEIAGAEPEPEADPRQTELPEIPKA